MILFDVHTIGEPVRHYQQYPDAALAQRMADHLSSVFHVPLVVEPVEEPAAVVVVYRIVATRRRRRHVESMDAGRSDPGDLEAAMRMWAVALPGWELHAIPETFSGSATKTPAGPGRREERG